MLYALPLVLLLRDARRPRRRATTGGIGRRPGRALRGSCSPTSPSSCWCSTSRCRRWRAGWCATGCRRSSRSSSTSARARPAWRRRSTGRSRPSSARSAGGWLADRWMRRHARGRIFVSAIGMALIVPAIFGVGNARRPAAGGGGRVPRSCSASAGASSMQQHADPVPDRAAGAAGHRLRHHEPREHQLRRPRRLGLRRAARPPGAAQRHLRRLRRAPPSCPSCSCC